MDMPPGQTLSPEFQILHFLAKLYIIIYHIKTEQSLQRLMRNGMDKIWVALCSLDG